ncbi:MAG: hypothetical protein GYA14_14595 [Ignavibacteria bacterium]|nr:hypothetical protein [Ignavibacteria bacterium]
MKSKFLILFLITISVIYAGVELINFTAKSQNGNVILNWQTAAETNLKHFVVERKSIDGNFFEIAVVEPKSDKNYQYVDQSAFKTLDAVYSYRIKIVDNDGSVSYSGIQSVYHNVSSVKRTWGSIKALFR